MCEQRGVRTIPLLERDEAALSTLGQLRESISVGRGVEDVAMSFEFGDGAVMLRVTWQTAHVEVGCAVAVLLIECAQAQESS